MKLSQVLDAYYSSRGVLSTNVKACNRKTNFNQLSSQLSQQVRNKQDEGMEAMCLFHAQQSSRFITSKIL